MGDSTQDSSGSCQDLFKRMKASQTDQPSASSAGSSPNVVSTDSCTYSRGKKELGSDGFEKYSIDDGVEVYFSKVPESALFNDGNAVTTRAQPNVMVGLYRTRPKVEVQVKEVQSVGSLSAEELFADVARGEEQVIDTKVGAYRNGVFMNPKMLSQMKL